MATPALSSLQVYKDAVNWITFSVASCSAGDTFTIPCAKALYGLFIYDTGSSMAVTGLSISGTTATIGAGPSAKTGTGIIFGYK